MYGGDQPALNMDGMLPLAEYPDCTEPYLGENRSETWYIVAWGEAGRERLFPSTKAHRALAYAQSFNPNYKVFPVLAHQLCRQAVEDALLNP